MGKPKTKLEGVLWRDTSQILGIRGWWRRAENKGEWKRLPDQGLNGDGIAEMG
jgi:hypothetical protein